jgi:hypothetical protein
MVTPLVDASSDFVFSPHATFTNAPTSTGKVIIAIEFLNMLPLLETVRRGIQPATKDEEFCDSTGLGHASGEYLVGLPDSIRERICVMLVITVTPRENDNVRDCSRY